ncbi:MAG: aspartate-semialdehyde dehydrogenase [Proteobacteria bacterium]|nr:aspartate-semialdehyde dehydrogenase [Pseudomonadota bacterium]
MAKIGIIGWRGMVGSVLMERMIAEKDLVGHEVLYFTTSQVSQQGPGEDGAPLLDAHDISVLSGLDIAVTCQGSGYTKKVYPELRKTGWNGYWIDAASALRMADEAIVVLDPVNRDVIDKGLNDGVKVFVGGNCTVSLMLMGVAGLFRAGLVEWLSSMTYQASSGAGAKNMTELVAQMAALGGAAEGALKDPASTALDLDKLVIDKLRSADFPTENFGVPLAASLIPWIDSPMDGGQTREEWKGVAETNKILGSKEPIPIDGICVRVGAMRCHSQGLTIKLKKDLPLDEIEAIIGNDNEWVKVIPNTKEASIKELSPAAVSGTLSVPVGRIHKMNIGPEYLTAFTVGDQLLWGAAEPVRRILRIILER